MGLKTKISDDIKTAMKAQDKDRLQVLRMVLSELKYAQAQSGNVHDDLPLADEQKVVASYLKKLDKSLGDYPEGEARDKIKFEMQVVESYLPQRASEAEIKQAVAELLASTPERNFGLLMKQLSGKFGTNADGKTLSTVLKQSLEAK
jgi:uncharacterized protein YqeY